MIDPQSEQEGESSWPWNVIFVWLISTDADGFGPTSAGAGNGSASTGGSRRTMPMISCCVPLRNYEASQRKM